MQNFIKKSDLTDMISKAFDWFMTNEGFFVSDSLLTGFLKSVEWEFDRFEQERADFEEWDATRVMECSVCGERLNDDMAACLQGDVLCYRCFGWGVGVLEGANARPRSSQAPI